METTRQKSQFGWQDSPSEESKQYSFEDTQKFESNLLKKILVLVVFSAVAVAALWVFFIYEPLIFTTSAAKFENSPLYDASTGSLKLREITGGVCDVFVSGPSKVLQYYGSFGCSELGTASITKSELLASFGGSGVYSLVVFSEDSKSGYDESFEIK